MPKTKPLQQLQDSLNTLFGYRKSVDAKIKHTEGLINERRLDKNALAKARRLADLHGIEIEKDDGTESDPCEGNHFCSSGREVLQTVEVYVEHLQRNGASK